MLRISRLTDYGIVLLSIFARDGRDRRHNARDLAAEATLPLPTVSKILKALARDGLLESHRGVNGGYSLARDPRDVTMLEVITALEGPVALTVCSDENSSCDLEASCPSRSHLITINRAVVGALERVHLADLAQPAPVRLLTLGGVGAPGKDAQ